jgi:hypothetical protein
MHTVSVEVTEYGSYKLLLRRALGDEYTLTEDVAWKVWGNSMPVLLCSIKKKYAN